MMRDLVRASGSTSSQTWPLHTSFSLTAAGVLIVLFLVVLTFTPLFSHGVLVALPDAGGTTVVRATENDLVITIKADGIVFVGPWVTRPATLHLALAEATSEIGDPSSVILRCDKNVSLGTVNLVVAGVRDAGWSTVCLVTFEGDMLRAYALMRAT